MAEAIPWGLATPRSIDFSWLGNLPDAYQEGIKQQQERNVLDARSHPVIGPNGQPDYAATLTNLLKAGDLQGAAALTGIQKAGEPDLKMIPGQFGAASPYIWDAGSQSLKPAMVQGSNGQAQSPSNTDFIGPDGQPLTGPDLLNAIKQANPTIGNDVEQLANYNTDPTKVASMRGDQRSMLMGLAGRVSGNPNFGTAGYNLVNATRKNFTSGPDADTLRGADQVVAHMGVLKNAFDDLNTQAGGPAQNMGPLNAPYNAVRGAYMASSQVPKLSALGVASTGVANELAKLFKGTGSTHEQEIAAWKSFAAAATTPGQQQEALQTAAQLMNGALEARKNKYESALNSVDPSLLERHPFPWNFSKQSLATFEKLGVSPEVGGNASDSSASNIPPQAIQALKANPALAPQFEQKYQTPVAQFLGQ